MNKSKKAQAINPNESSERDRCQTPPYALTPLLPYLPKQTRIWESAAGEGLLATALRLHGYTVEETDILDGHNFFETRCYAVDMQITNPPFSTKYLWLKRSYEIGLPFALLVPWETLVAKTAQELFKTYGFEAIVPDDRIDFKIPGKGWGGAGAHFHTVWLTWGLGIGERLTYEPMHKPSKQRLAEMARGWTQLPMFGAAGAP